MVNHFPVTAYCLAISIAVVGADRSSALEIASQGASDPMNYQHVLDRIEEAMGFPGMRAGRGATTSRELRILNWTPTAAIPMAALRLVETRAGVDAQFMIVWNQYVSYSIRRPRSGSPCARVHTCVEMHDLPFLEPPAGETWSTLFGKLLALEPCEDRSPGATVTIITDVGDLVMQVADDGGFRQYFCNAVQYRLQTESGRLGASLFRHLQDSMLRALGR